MSMSFNIDPEAEIAYRRERITATYRSAHLNKHHFPWRRRQVPASDLPSADHGARSLR